MQMRQLILAGAAAAALAPTALSAQDTETFRDIEAVDIENFIGTVTIRTGGDRVTVRKSDGTEADYPFYMETENARLTLRSDEDPDDWRWRDEVDWRKHHENAFAAFLEAYPSLELTIPRGTALSFDSAVIMLDADDTGGAFELREGHVDGKVGDLSEADINIHGSGDLVVGDVADMLDINIHGSGDFAAGDAGRLNANIHGSGDIRLGDVSGPASASIHGSGDIELGDVGGPIDVSVHGSGDVKSASVNGGADLSMMGAGDIYLATVAGKTAAKIHGSGDIDIADGRADDLLVRVNGSGDFAFLGLATNPDVAANGSGSIRIKSHEGPVRARGRGDIRISGVDYGRDD